MPGFLTGLLGGLTSESQAPDEPIDVSAVAADDKLIDSVAADTIDPTDEDPDVDIAWAALLDRL